ncbi:protein kinase [Streptomyces sp. NPDC087908]|uniref:serine/threonine-protein kinase n=1 Tax=Streptomyces sp. NPDC087908 TaxID=3365820 RepID=UPI0038299BF8
MHRQPYPQLSGFTMLRLIGSGASGEVMEAVETRTGTKVAVKHLNPSFLSDTEQLDAFRAEAAVIQEIASPQVARFYEYREHATGAAIVMELVHGPSLREVLRTQRALPPEAALHVMKGSLLGLAAAHEAGVVHRDYKPGNVLVTATGDSKLVDFGIAIRHGATARSAGTPAYMAPEQWHGGLPTPATDVYAAATAFFECLTGDRPYQGETLHALALQHVTAPVPYHRVPAPLHELVRRGLAKAPEHRPADAWGFLAALEHAATTTYGADWEERGKRALAALAALTPLLWRSDADGSESGSDAATTSVDAPPETSRTALALSEQNWKQGSVRHAGRMRRRILGASACTAAVAGLVVGVAALAQQDPEQKTAHQRPSHTSVPQTDLSMGSSDATTAPPVASRPSSSSGTPGTGARPAVSAQDGDDSRGADTAASSPAVAMPSEEPMGDLPGASSANGSTDSPGPVIPAGEDAPSTGTQPAQSPSPARSPEPEDPSPSASSAPSPAQSESPPSPITSASTSPPTPPTQTPTPTSSPTPSPPTTSPTPSPPTTSPPPTHTGSTPPVPVPERVRELGVTRFTALNDDTALVTVTVRTESTGPVTLHLRWFGSDGAGTADQPGTQDGHVATFYLSGRTEYRVTSVHLFDAQLCAERWAVLATIDPQADQARPYRSLVAPACRGPFG